MFHVCLHTGFLVGLRCSTRQVGHGRCIKVANPFIIWWGCAENLSGALSLIRPVKLFSWYERSISIMEAACSIATGSRCTGWRRTGNREPKSYSGREPYKVPLGQAMPSRATLSCRLLSNLRFEPLKILMADFQTTANHSFTLLITILAYFRYSVLATQCCEDHSIGAK